MPHKPSTIFTIGHSNQTIDAFLTMLRQHAVRVVIDVRSSPYSRYAPHFSKRPLQQALSAAGIRYLFLGDRLGGMPQSDACYDSDGHVLYGEIAAGQPFQEALQLVIEQAAEKSLTLMCAEENPENCHRRHLIARALRDRGLIVRHIRGDSTIIDDSALRSAELSAIRQPSLFEESPPVWRSPHPVRRREPSRGPFETSD